MNIEDLREAIKWAIIATLVVVLWCSVVLARQARSEKDVNAPSGPELPQQETGEPIPVWVILVYETRGRKLVGITEFVFRSYDACQRGAEEAQSSLGLHIRPMCYLRWLRAASDNAM